MVGGTFAVALAIVLILFGAPRLRFRPENYKAIRPGMTLQQVEDLLGGPPGDYGWFLIGSTIMTEEGSIVPPGSKELLWFNDNHRIEVFFDGQGRVVAVHKRAKWERGPWPW
jgi:hypothetical protein